jgi:hypothetical protein
MSWEGTVVGGGVGPGWGGGGEGRDEGGGIGVVRAGRLAELKQDSYMTL